VIVQPNKNPQTMLALFNIGGGEIALILILLMILAVPIALTALVIYFVVRATRRKQPDPTEAAPPGIPTSKS
jgi:hypothetical protein